ISHVMMGFSTATAALKGHQTLAIETRITYFTPIMTIRNRKRGTTISEAQCHASRFLGDRRPEAVGR
ncbi:hypothetical protein BaRGS_00005790, partial [Batillaria attramentaria]